MNATPLDKLLSAVGDYRRAGGGFQARCPAHEDRNPSLSIRQTEDGTVLLKCKAGCSADMIAKAVGMTMRDLFPRVKGGAR